MRTVTTFIDTGEQQLEKARRANDSIYDPYIRAFFSEVYGTDDERVIDKTHAVHYCAGYRGLEAAWEKELCLGFALVVSTLECSVERDVCVVCHKVSLWLSKNSILDRPIRAYGHYNNCLSYFYDKRNIYTRPPSRSIGEPI